VCYRIVDARAGLGDPLMRRCERCGSSGPLTHHHRVKRSHGGEHMPSNVVVLCGSGTGAGCHLWAEHHPAEAEAEGWSVPSTVNPATVPIFHKAVNMRVLLDDDGMLIPTETDQ
jgi:hypothetical protein